MAESACRQLWKKYLLEAHFETDKSFAAQLGVDAALISKWINGKALPAANHRPRIWQLLNVPEADQHRLLQECFEVRERRPDGRRGARNDRIQENLEQSPRRQRRAIRNPAEEPNSQTAEDRGKEILETLHRITSKIDCRDDKDPDLENLADSLVLTPSDSNGVVEMITQVLRNLPPNESPGGRVIITYDIESSVSETLRTQWERALHLALRHGWNIQHLVHTNHLLRSVPGMLKWVGLSGSYEPLVRTEAEPRHDLRDGGVLGSPAFVVIPSMPSKDGSATPGLAILSFSNSTHAGAIGVQSQRQVELLRTWAERQLNFGTVSFLSCYRSNARGRLDLEDRFAEALDGTNQQFLMKRGFTTLTLPTDWLKPESPWAMKLIESGEWSPDQVQKLIKSRTTRHAAFDDFREKKGVLKVISPESAVHDLIKGDYAQDDPAQRAGFKLSPCQAIEYLTELIKFLAKYNECFQLALLPDESRIEVTENFWFVRDEETVIIEIWRDNCPHGTEHVGIEIKNRGLASDFTQVFQDLWIRIPESQKDPENTIVRLTRILENWKATYSVSAPRQI